MGRGEGETREPGSLIQDAREAFGVFSAVVFLCARAWSVFTRRNTGHNCRGWAIVFVPMIAVFYSNYLPSAGERAAMVYFSFAFILGCLLQSYQEFVRGTQGLYVHSRFVGDSVLANWFPRLTGSQVRAFIEPPVLIAASVVIGFVTGCRGLQSFLIFSAFCVFIEERLMTLRDVAMVNEFRDRMIEQRNFADELRND